MERLKSACLLALIAFAAPAAIGQQATPIQQQTGTVAVIGDVEHCDNYALPAGSALTVQEAVRKAGPLSDTVQVKVIRAGQDRAQWTQNVSATSTDNGEPVTNGDVLVVQSLAPLTVRVQQNAVLRTDTSLLVVGLTQEGIVIGDVLQQTNNLPLAKGQLKVISRFQGQKPIARAELHLPMAHGDVVSISRDSQTVLKGFGGMSPTFSEWKGTAAPPAHVPFIPNITTPDGDGSRDLPQRPLLSRCRTEGHWILIRRPKRTQQQTPTFPHWPSVSQKTLSMGRHQKTETASPRKQRQLHPYHQRRPRWMERQMPPLR